METHEKCPTLTIDLKCDPCAEEMVEFYRKVGERKLSRPFLLELEDIISSIKQAEELNPYFVFAPATTKRLLAVSDITINRETGDIFFDRIEDITNLDDIHQLATLAELADELIEAIKDHHRCGGCMGKGKKFIHMNLGNQGGKFGFMECSKCKGCGLISEAQAANIARGRALADYRRKNRITVREMAKNAGIDFIWYTRIEEGLEEMPEKLQELISPF